MAMVMCILAVTQGEVVIFSVAVIGAFLLLFATFFGGWWLSRHQSSPSPYSGLPLRSGKDLSYLSMEKILRYIYELNDLEHNPIFDIPTSAFCRETGRIFPHAKTWWGTIRIDWSFIQKRCPQGNFVSWGSLTKAQQKSIREQHDSIDDFQTEVSSPKPNPKNIEAKYAFTKPGPLYVDRERGILLGWQWIPDSELEVLVLQMPTKS